MISIIVPVYNMASYLPQCLDSIRNQTFTDLDVILMDDGSTDGSGEICDRYAAADARFRVFHTANQGHYLARGFAIRKAREQGSEYIGFVEGNDVTSGKVQVVVTDGFTGNVMLKTVEGTAK